jgi:hypothetical protein
MSLDPSQVVDAPFYSKEFGEFLPSKAARLAEILHDYNPYLELRFIPRMNRDETDTHPFAIWDTSPWRGRGGYPVRHLSEQEINNPQEVLRWLFEGDLSKHGFSEIKARAMAKESAEQLLKHKKEAEIAEQRQDLAATMVSGGRNRLSSFRHNGKIFSDSGVRNVSQTIH